MTTRKYLFEGRTPGGDTQSGHVEAESVADARLRLAGQGLANVVIHEDDFLADLRAAGERESGLPRPADLDLLIRHDPSVLGMTQYMLRKNWLTVAIMAAILGALALSHVSWIVWAIVLGVCAFTIYLLLVPGWLQWRQNEMYRKFWAGDWEASEAIAARLRGMRLVDKLESAKLEFDSRIAACRIMKGDIEGGYALLAPWKSSGLAGGVFLYKLGALHFLARDWKSAVDVHERIFAENSGDTQRIDLAQTLARFGNDDARAASLLEGLDPAQTVPIHQGFVNMGRGVLALKRGDNTAAVGVLARAVEQLQTLAVNPVVWGALAICTGYLAVAMARTGRLEAAREMLVPVQGIVERHGEDQLLQWLRAERLLEGHA